MCRKITFRNTYSLCTGDEGNYKINYTIFKVMKLWHAEEQAEVLFLSDRKALPTVRVFS